MTRIWVTILVLMALSCLSVLARTEESLEQLIARAESAPPGDRPRLYIQIARQQAESADKLYQAGNSEAGNTALSNVVTYSEKASDAASRSGKKLKDTEIALRKMAEKFRDVKHNVPFDDQAPIQQAIDRLEKMRTDLLSAMFGKKKGTK
jgi:rubrerythrin